MHAETLRPLEAIRGRRKESERASGGMFSPRSNNVNFNKDKQTHTKTAPLGATDSLKGNDQMSFSSTVHLFTSNDGEIFQRLGASRPETRGESFRANYFWGELADILFCVNFFFSCQEGKHQIPVALLTDNFNT